MSYQPNQKEMATLGYALVGHYKNLGASVYHREVPAPVAPWTATLVVEVFPQAIFLKRRASTREELWKYPVPTPLFFTELLTALGWPTTPIDEPSEPSSL